MNPYVEIKIESYCANEVLREETGFGMEPSFGLSTRSVAGYNHGDQCDQQGYRDMVGKITIALYDIPTCLEDNDGLTVNDRKGELMLASDSAIVSGESLRNTRSDAERAVDDYDRSFGVGDHKCYWCAANEVRDGRESTDAYCVVKYGPKWVKMG
ncbi:hypothetical protein GQ457_09G025780 [Hibiscus cannabinus]